MRMNNKQFSKTFHMEWFSIINFVLNSNMITKMRHLRFANELVFAVIKLITSSYTRNKSFAVFVSVRQKKEVTDGRTDRPTDGPIDGRTHPLIESWLTTKN